MREKITKRTFLFTIIAVCLLLGIYAIYDTLHFHLRYTTPNLNTVPTSSTQIEYHFTQPIKSVDRVTLNGTDVTTSVHTDDRIITVPLSKLSTETSYRVTLQGIQSEWFNAKMSLLTTDFKPVYIDFNNLSDQEKAAQIEASDSGQSNDQFINNNTFPIFNERWQIDATTFNDSQEVILSVTFFDEVPDYDNGGTITQIPNEIANLYEKQVYEEIKKRGGKPENYTIIFKTNRYLTEKHDHSDKHHD